MRLVLPWHRRSSYEPDAPARGVPQSPRWRVGLVCARMRNFLAGVIGDQSTCIHPFKRFYDVAASVSRAVEHDPLDRHAIHMGQSTYHVGSLDLALELRREDFQHSNLVSHDNHALSLANTFTYVATKHYPASRSTTTEQGRRGRCLWTESEIQPLGLNERLVRQFRTDRLHMRAIPG